VGGDRSEEVVGAIINAVLACGGVFGCDGTINLG
jgi:hypothetical protein